MNKGNKNRGIPPISELKGRRHGKSSYHMHDPQLVFNELNLREGDCFLDFGCGVGDYAVHASKIVGDSGRVYALDISKTMVDGLTELADSQGFKNVEAMVSDISHPLPIKNNCVDVCLIATVLHIIGLAEDGKKLFKEIYRVLKKDGQLSIINCKKEAQPFGPPLQMRLAPTEVEESLKKHGFEKTNIIDLGYNYMITFQKPENRQDFKEAQ